MLRRTLCLTMLGAFAAVAGPVPAWAADLSGSPHGFPETYQSSRSVRERHLPPAYAFRCPWRKPADYRPRLIGAAGCAAARPDGLSPTLYGPRIGTEWGVDY